MKTHILQLEPYDDAISVRDKMGWGQAARVLLVWPRQGRVLHRRLDLVLLQRHSLALGAQLALVSKDPDVKYYASRLGIPVFKNMHKAQSSHWRTSRRRPKRIQRQAPRPDLEAMRMEVHPNHPGWLERPAVRRGYYAGTLLVFLIMAAVLLPGARVTLDPETRIQDIQLVAAASQSITHPTLSGDLPAHPVSIIVEGRDVISTTGRTALPAHPASGNVKFTNLTDREVNIPEGTVVTTLADYSGKTVRFATTRPGTIPAGPGSTLNLIVRALSPGTTSNLRPNTIQALEGPLGLSLSVTNTLPTSGGIDSQAPSPSSGDYDYLYDQLSEKLRQTALLELTARSPFGSFPITSTLTLSQTLEETYDPPLLEEGHLAPTAERLSLTLRLEFQALVISEDDLKIAAAGILNATLPEGFTPNPETLEIRHLSSPVSTNSGMYHWQISVQRQIKANMPGDLVAGLVRGRSPEQASDILTSSLRLASPAKIQMTPSWWPLLPVLPIRVGVEEAN